MVIDAAGNSTYVWEEALNGNQTVVRSRVYGADGSVGPVRSVTGTADPGEPSDAVTAIDGSGRVRVAWLQRQFSCTPNCSSAFQVKTVELDGDGNPVGEPLTIKSFALGEASIGNLQLAENAGGKAVIAFSHYDFASEVGTIDVYSVSGGEVSNITPSGEGEEPTGDIGIAVNDAGTVFATWMNYVESFHSVVEGALIGAGFSGVAHSLGTTSVVNGYDLAAVIDAEGNGTAVYQGQPEGLETQVYAERLDADGSTPGAQMLSDASGRVAQFAAHGLALAPDGSIFVGWSQNNVPKVTRLAPDGSVGPPHPLSQELEGWEVVLARGPAGDGIAIFGTGEYGSWELDQVSLDADGAPTGPVTRLGMLGSSENYFGTESTAVAISSEGDAAAVWLEFNHELEASEVLGALHDGVAPSVSLFAPAQALAGAPTVLAASGEDANPISYAWSFGDGSGGSGPVVQHTYSAPGVYTASVTATDSAGNATTRQADVQVLAAGGGTGGQAGAGGNSGPPAAPVVRPETAILKAPPKKLRKRRAVVRFVSSQPGSSFECALDAEGWKPCHSPLKLKGLAPGAHRVKVRATAPNGIVEARPPVVRFRVLKRKHSS